MRYEGAVYRRDSSNDTQTLYICEGDDVRTGKFKPCRGKVAFKLNEIWGELIEWKARLIGHSLHSHWCEFFEANKNLSCKARIDGSPLLEDESRRETENTEEMEAMSGDASSSFLSPMIREPESPPKRNKERPRNAEYNEEKALSDRSSGDEGFDDDETYSISSDEVITISDDEEEIVDKSELPVVDFGYSQDNLMKAAPTYLKSSAEEHPSNQPTKTESNFSQIAKNPPNEKLEKTLDKESSYEEMIKESNDDLYRIIPINNKLAELRKSINEQREIVDDLGEKMKKTQEQIEDLEREFERDSNKSYPTWLLNGQAANQNRVTNLNHAEKFKPRITLKKVDLSIPKNRIIDEIRRSNGETGIRIDKISVLYEIWKPYWIDKMVILAVDEDYYEEFFAKRVIKIGEGYAKICPYKAGSGQYFNWALPQQSEQSRRSQAIENWIIETNNRNG